MVLVGLEFVFEPGEVFVEELHAVDESSVGAMKG